MEICGTPLQFKEISEALDAWIKDASKNLEQTEGQNASALASRISACQKLHTDVSLKAIFSESTDVLEIQVNHELLEDVCEALFHRLTLLRQKQRLFEEAGPYSKNTWKAEKLRRFKERVRLVDELLGDLFSKSISSGA